MKQLSFELPEFIRTSWVSEIAREIWEPRINEITKAWQEIAWLSVAENICKCATMSISPDYFISLAEKCLKANIIVLPLGYQGVQNYFYTNQSPIESAVKQFLLNVVIGSSENVLNFKYLNETANTPASICELLGYPPCCSKSFENVLEQGVMDTTWFMSVATAGFSDSEKNCIEVTGDPLTNILWRWLDIRAIPHLPCSFRCKVSLELGKQYMDVGRQHGYSRELDWMLEILSWPVEWSALHGIAEIKTPILKASTRTDATAIKYVVKRTADTYPLEGAKGLHFPYQTLPSHPPVQSNKNSTEFSSITSSRNRGEIYFNAPWYHKDNGFSLRSSMDAAHKPIEKLAVATLSKQPKQLLNVLDLGCGNGALLRKIQLANPDVMPFGIDIDPARINHARMLLPGFGNNFVVGDVVNFDSLLPECNYALIILSLRRLKDMDITKVVMFSEQVQKCCNNLLVYDYYNHDFEKLAQQFRVQLLSPAPSAEACLAKFDINSREPVNKVAQHDSGKNNMNKNNQKPFYTDYSDHSDSY